MLVLLTALLAAPARAQNVLSEVRALLSDWHHDPSRIDRARALLEQATQSRPAPEVLVALAETWFLTGEFRARTEQARVAAYEQGAAWARRAIAAAPRSERAHFLLAINNGRLADAEGVMRAFGLLAKVREESEAVLRLNPASVEGLILAGGLAAQMPSFLGGDRAKAEALFKRALELDPHQTGGRLEMAELYVATRRWRDAHRELQAVLDERSPTDVPRWTISERPRAERLLAELRERGRITGGAPEAP